MKQLYKIFAITILNMVLAIFFVVDISAQSVYDVKQTTVSDMVFYVSNYGILGNNTATGKGGLIYPRGTENQYLYGTGTWFGTKKRVNDTLKNLVTLTYNHNTGSSWMNPGNIGDLIPMPSEMITKYNVERSTDFNLHGINKNSAMPPWSLWKTTESDATGTYEPTTTERNSTKYKNGLAVVSDEMFHTRYKDNDLSRYDGGSNARKSQGYPLGLQFDEKIYSWSKAPYNSSIIVQQTITNTSTDTLFDSYIGNIFDPDIGIIDKQGATNNDFVRTAKFGDNDGVYSWSGGNFGELGNNFGYMAIAHLETPAVNNDVIKSIKYSNQAAPLAEQIGTTSVRYFTNNDAFNLDNERYDFISSAKKDSAKLNAEIKVLIGTGPFTILPGQTARITYCITIVKPTSGKEATGNEEDLPAIKDAILSNKQNYLNNLLTSVEDNNVANNWTLSPNPITDQFNLQYTSEFGGEIKVSLFNLTGVKIADLQTGMANLGVNNFNFNISNLGLAAGVYSIRIDNSKSTISQMIVVAR